MKKTRHILRSTLIALGITAVVTVAFWALLSSGKGSSPATRIGKAPAPAEYSYALSFPADKIKPGGSATESPLTIETTNSGAETQAKKVKVTFALDAEHETAGCKTSYFFIGNGGPLWTELQSEAGTTTPVKIKTGTVNDTAAFSNPSVQMKEEVADQKSCLAASEGGVGSESARLTVSFAATP